MKVVKYPDRMQAICRRLKAQGKRLGFVPTMGYLHEGHLSLMRQAKAENDICIISIFVNPLQFGPREDFKRYPRDFNRDRKLAKDVGVDFIFFPSQADMYSHNFSSEVNAGKMGEILCGISRPGHFKGVTTVVLKLLNITLADVAYFGQKDFQQARIIQNMVKDLNHPVKIKMLPIIRDEDGLAMSSRNRYLSTRGRSDARVLYRSLIEARRKIGGGCRSSKAIISTIKNLISTVRSARIDYIVIVDVDDSSCMSRLRGEIAILLAVKIGGVRLIDNIIIKI
ncbi:MAG: pantoate--beta-alanine ligase [Candidatus Omnitrophica bacterium]|nr:pantoate--beta-alanine ligase [Candidatus Omnitrophota bacterium]